MHTLRHAALALLFALCLAAGHPAVLAEDAAVFPEATLPADSGDFVLGAGSPEVDAAQAAQAEAAEAAERKSLEDAMELLKKATDDYADKLLASPPEGMTEGDVALALGNLYALGVLGFPNDNKAKEYLELALEKGIPEAGVALGALYLETGDGDHDHDGDGAQDHPGSAEGREADVEKALAYYRDAAKGGSVDAMRVLGRLFSDGDNGVTPDQAEGEKYLLDAAHYGDDYSLDRLEGKFNEAAAWEKDHPGEKAAFPTSRQAAIDPALAAKRAAWNERMASNINTVYLGMEKVLFQAMGMDYDAMTSRKKRQAGFLAAFDRVAAEVVASRPDTTDKAETAFAIGAIYSFGLSGGVNLDEAEKYYRMAADNGLDEAWAAIAELHAGGVPDMNFASKENTAKAVEYFQKAADKGVARAMFALGGLYLEGREDLPADHDKAIGYFRQAAEWGDEDAIAALDKMIASMPEAERKEKGLPAKAIELVDPKKAEQAAERMTAIQAAFERTETLIREKLENEMAKLEGPAANAPDAAEKPAPETKTE